MNFMNNPTIDALTLILKEQYDKADPLNSPLKELIPPSRLVTAKKGEMILCKNDPADYFYFILSGRAVILNDIEWNNDNIIDYVESPHILGLIESLGNVPVYTAFVVAETACILYRISAREFTDIIRNDGNLCYDTLVILGKVTENNMEQAEAHKILHPKDNLGHFLYVRAKDHIPYICPMTRIMLAEELHINLRTLYRYIDDLRKKGCLTLKKGKICIEQEHLDRLDSRYGDIIF